LKIEIVFGLPLNIFYELLIVVFKREEAAARTWGEDKDEKGEEGRDGTGENPSG